ncbi:hypothetical protein F5B22DRAFT_373193 [Xylaria bambusicola]|uniref:uncharacterized protein n=1 Tax=Xylaria bambusicola TaxID=326684 RepID=UPI0020085E57|nr:uncharacterized protein F5B22DRAFT_373193 [Xylaria bambusicola]KAI0509114.1 hypothetical protein F5B22DRAFT_373193 [Xylaria bambusicola]
MKLTNVILGAAALTHGINAVAVPEAEAVALDTRTPQPESETHFERSSNEELWKRKGGGGGGGRGGGSGGGRGSGSGRGGGGGAGGRGLGSSTSNVGGRTTTGSGPTPAYGGGAYYGGGATVPYKAGNSAGRIAPALLTGAAIGGIGFLGVSYLYGAYAYPYYHHYYYHNATTDMNETKPVICVCDPYDTCTCDDNGNQTYFNSVIGNGSYEGLNHTLVTIAKNDTTGNLTIYINGQVPNGTTAAGGTEDPSAANSMIALAKAAGWWPAATMAFAIAFLV